MLNVLEVINHVRCSAEKMHAAKTEKIGSPSVGDVVRQGDVYLVNIETMPDNGNITNETQLVPGNSQGSRHVLIGNATIKKDVKFKNFDTQLTGPAFHCNSDVEVDHPEHGNKILPAGTTWQCIYQRAYAEEIRRVQD